MQDLRMQNGSYICCLLLPCQTKAHTAVILMFLPYPAAQTERTEGCTHANEPRIGIHAGQRSPELSCLFFQISPGVAAPTWAQTPKAPQMCHLPATIMLHLSNQTWCLRKRGFFRVHVGLRIDDLQIMIWHLWLRRSLNQTLQIKSPTLNHVSSTSTFHFWILQDLACTSEGQRTPHGSLDTAELQQETMGEDGRRERESSGFTVLGWRFWNLLLVLPCPCSI